MEKISRPNLVDLLRLADREKWFCPRIRFASVRSKPELIHDLRRLFRDVKKGELVRFLPKSVMIDVPRIEYSTKLRSFLLDGVQIDVPKISREKPVFSIRYGKYTMYFDLESRPGSEAPPSTA